MKIAILDTLFAILTNIVEDNLWVSFFMPFFMKIICDIKHNEVTAMLIYMTNYLFTKQYEYENIHCVYASI